MASYRITNLCNLLISDMRRTPVEYDHITVKNVFQMIFMTDNPKLYVGQLVEITHLFIKKSGRTDAVDVMRNVLHEIVQLSTRHMKCVCIIAQYVISTIAVSELEFDQTKLMTFLPVLDDVLWRLPMVPELRLHVICHIILKLKPVLRLKIGNSYVAEIISDHFICALKRCDNTTVLVDSKLALLREVVTLFSMATLIRTGPNRIYEILHAAFERSETILKWTIWLSVSGAFMRKINGCFRDEINPNDERLFKRLLHLSAYFAIDEKLIAPDLQEEIRQFCIELKSFYSLKSKERICFCPRRMEVDNCTQYDCKLFLKPSMVEELNKRDTEDTKERRH